MNTPSDAQLVAFVRTGEESAFDELHQRHLAAARRTARIVAENDDHADEIVADAFDRVRTQLTAGSAPAIPFAVHVRTVIRRIALDQYRSGEMPASAATGAGPGGSLGLVDAPDAGRASDAPLDHQADGPLVSGAGATDAAPHGADQPSHDRPIGPRVEAAPSDTEAERMNERHLIRAAYEALPERWQRVLWRTEIEERPPADLAPELGSSPNSVASLAFRAREGLRQAYLAVNHAGAADDRCRQLIPRLAGYVRQTLPEAEDVAVAIHLDTCALCRARRDELLLLVSDLRALLVAALIGMTPLARPTMVPAARQHETLVAVPATVAAPGAAARSRVRPRRVIQVAATTLVSAAAAVGVAFAVVTSMSPAPQPDDNLVAPGATSPAVEPARSSVANQSVPVTSPFTAEDEDDESVDDGTDDAADDAAQETPPTAVRPPNGGAPGGNTSHTSGGTPTGADDTGTEHEDVGEPGSGSATTAPSSPPTSTPASRPAGRSTQPAPSDPPSSPPAESPATEPPTEDEPGDTTPPRSPAETPDQEQTGLCVLMRVPLLCP